jgi:hypothetical protein
MYTRALVLVVYNLRTELITLVKQQVISSSVVKRPQLQNSALTAAILVDAFCGLPQSLQPNAELGVLGYNNV